MLQERLLHTDVIVRYIHIEPVQSQFIIGVRHWTRIECLERLLFNIVTTIVLYSMIRYGMLCLYDSPQRSYSDSETALEPISFNGLK